MSAATAHFEEITAQNIFCSVEQKVLVHFARDKSGHPVKLEGRIYVSVRSGDGTFEIQPDEVSCYFVSPDVPGKTVYLIHGPTGGKVYLHLTSIEAPPKITSPTKGVTS